MSGPNPLYCSFCGRSKDETCKLISSTGANICDRCVIDCIFTLIHTSHPHCRPPEASGPVGEAESP